MTRLIKKVNRWAKRHMRYRQIVRELSALNDKELADIGINRSDIYRVANEGRI